jgi:hypothetical protein
VAPPAARPAPKGTLMGMPAVGATPPTATPDAKTDDAKKGEE